MPINLDISNAIVNSFLAGQQLSKQKREEERSVRQQDIENRAREQQRAEQVKQFNEQLTENKRQFDVTQKALAMMHELEQEGQRMQLQEQVLKTGITPPGYKKVTQGQNFPVASGTGELDLGPTASITYQPENPESTLSSFEIGMTPEQYAERQGKLTAIQNEPAIQGQIRIKQAEDAFKIYQDNLQYRRDLDKIRLQNEGRNEAARIRGQQQSDRQLDAPIHPDVQRDVFGLKDYNPNLTLRTAQGLKLIKPLTPAQQDKAADFADLQAQTLQLKDILEKKDPAGVSNYDKFYRGLAGGAYAEIKGKFYDDTKEMEDARQLASTIELKAKNLIGKLGGALTANEQQLLEKSAVSPNRGLTSVRGKAILDGFLQQLQESQSNLIKGNKTKSSVDDILFPPEGK